MTPPTANNRNLPMGATPAKRTQAERREQTQQKILASAIKLFGEKGYDSTALDDIARDAGITEGPIYHYYGNKKRLFQAVTELMEAGLSDAIEATNEDFSEHALKAGWQTFVDACKQPGFVQIVLIDSPHVLGRERWHETKVIPQVVRLLDKNGLFDDKKMNDVDKILMTRMLTAALAEAALMVANTPDYDASVVIEKMLGALIR